MESSVKVLPSSQAASINVTYEKDGKTDVPIRSGQDISVVAGELLQGVSKYRSHRANEEILLIIPCQAGIHRGFASMPRRSVKRHIIFCHACPSPAFFSTVCAIVI